MRTLPLPGFVDLQVNGYLGVDFSSPDLTAETFTHACRSLLQAGTAAFLPTLITSPLTVYERNLPLMAEVIARPEFHNRLLGIHLEGPFISPEPGAVGAHNPAWVRQPAVSVLQQLVAWSKHTVRLVTLAAECDGADELARDAAGQRIVISSGHSLASPADLDRLARAGATALTHLGNALPHQLHKFANPLWAGLADDRYTAMLISDGHHIPDGVLKAMIRAKGVNRTVIVSDASPITGLPAGRYTTLGNEVILEESGRLYNPEKGFLVGSSATLLMCINHLASLKFLSGEDLLTLGFHNPLRLIGVDPATLPSDESLLYEPNSGQFAYSNLR